MEILAIFFIFCAIVAAITAAVAGFTVLVFWGFGITIPFLPTWGAVFLATLFINTLRCNSK